jgi:hexokinase
MHSRLQGFREQQRPSPRSCPATPYRVMTDGEIWRLRDGILESMRRGFARSLLQLSSSPTRREEQTQKPKQGQGSEDSDQKSSLPMIILKLPQERKQIGCKGRLAIDLGGTNFRCALVDDNMEALKTQSWPVPCNDSRIFAWCAARVKEFLDAFPAIPDADERMQDVQELAFAFSFPVKQRTITEAYLLQWNKGFVAPEFIGRDVVKVFQGELAALGVRLQLTCIVNDTVATMLAAQYVHGPHSAGVIIGTGTNAACSLALHSKYSHGNDDDDEGGLDNQEDVDMVAVNTEWACFGMQPWERVLLPVRDFDQELLGQNAGQQPLEKLTSGLFLPVLYERITGQSLPNGAKDLSRLEAEHGDPVARMLSQRSVEIMAAAILALRDFSHSSVRSFCRALDEHSIPDMMEFIVAIDGSLFERYHGYSDRLRCLLESLDIVDEGGAVKAHILLQSGKDFSCFGACVY